MLDSSFWLVSRIGKFWALLKDAASGWSHHHASRIGAALAFYTVFSLGPILLLAVAIAGFFFGEKAARGHIYANVVGIIGPKAATEVQAVILHAARPGAGIIATAVSIVALILSANTALVELKSGLDQILEAPPQHRQWYWSYLRDRLLSIGLIVALGLLLLLSLLADVALSALSTLSQRTVVVGFILEWTSSLVSFGLAALLFATVYKVLPSIRLTWKDVWIGAVVTAALVSAGRLVIHVFIGLSRIAPAYGAAGSLIVVLLWVYYTAQVFLFGAEITRSYARGYGSQRTTDRVS